MSQRSVRPGLRVLALQFPGTGSPFRRNAHPLSAALGLSAAFSCSSPDTAPPDEPPPPVPSLVGLDARPTGQTCTAPARPQLDTGVRLEPAFAAGIFSQPIDLRQAPGDSSTFYQELERAGRVADFFELSELMCRDALARQESCGSHFRVEYATEQGEAKRNDGEFAHVAAWRYARERAAPVPLREPLQFEYVPLAERSYR